MLSVFLGNIFHVWFLILYVVPQWPNRKSKRGMLTVWYWILQNFE
jgi:hypothetical protein